MFSESGFRFCMAWIPTLVSVASEMSLRSLLLGILCPPLTHDAETHYINGLGAFQFHFLQMAVFLEEEPSEL